MTKKTDADWKPLEAFLRKLSYSDETIVGTLARARALERSRVAGETEIVPDHWWKHLQRLRAAEAAGKLPPKLGDYVETQIAGVTERRSARKGGSALRGGRKGKARKRPATSVPDGDWKRLLAWLAKPCADPIEEGARAVLYVEASTGLRVGDVLRIPVRDLAEGLRTGVFALTQKGGAARTIYVSGAPDAWARLGAAASRVPEATNIASTISSSPDASSRGAAYRRVWLTLQTAGVTLGIENLRTHRLRRTVGVQALRLTEDVAAVGQLLGHAPGSQATMGYLDEARPERVADLTQQIRKTFGGGA